MRNNMDLKNNHHFHIWHYTVLIFMLILGITFIFLFSGQPDKQFISAVIISAAYFLWGVVHHKLEGDLHPKIVVEYLLIALLALLLLKGAIFR